LSATKQFVIRTHIAYKEQPHNNIINKTFDNEDELEAYEELPYRFRGTKPFVMWNNFEAYEEQPHS
jgi:hypothetical protein